ncbi:MAG TPA: hypothetical protein DDY14_16735 [Chromatiaceae bacterium]|nr:hypothetical protein [Chromatiaceae bacterium]HCS89236.1 hypothetical protein [Chromatiaceae bacterium]
MLSTAIIIALLISPTWTQAGNHRLSGGHHAHNPVAGYTFRSKRPQHRNRIQGSRYDTLPPTDPALRQYWSNRCMQQPVRGWGHTGDCESPAYHGGKTSRRHRSQQGCLGAGNCAD